MSIAISIVYLRLFNMSLITSLSTYLSVMTQLQTLSTRLSNISFISPSHYAISYISLFVSKQQTRTQTHTVLSPRFANLLTCYTNLHTLTRGRLNL